MVTKPKASGQAGAFRKRRVLLAIDSGASVERRAGIMQYAREAGWILDSRVMAFLVHGQQEEYLASAQFDGVISMTSGLTRSIYPVIRAMKLPTVELWYDFPRWKVPRVLPDHQAAGAMGADHLLGLGLRSLLFYSHTVDRRVASIRWAAFQAQATRHGVDAQELWWDPTVSARRKLGRIGWLASRLKQLPLPLGVLAVNDAVATEVVDAAEQAGLSVPGQVAVLGIDNDSALSELGSIPLSSIDIARDRIGYEAATLLDKLMAGGKAPREPILIPPAGVVTRRSTETIAVADPDIAKAARFIHEHFREPITVADVAAHTFLSRRRLQDRFQSAIGHSMSEEITRQRIDFCKHLLTHTTHKISTIAALAGFTSLQRLSKVFRRVLATTPQAYRQTYQSTRLQHD